MEKEKTAKNNRRVLFGAQIQSPVGAVTVKDAKTSFGVDIAVGFVVDSILCVCVGLCKFLPTLKQALQWAATIQRKKVASTAQKYRTEPFSR